jgi:hypothetical protein
MPTITYIDKRFNRSSQVVIDHAAEILGEYAAQGYTMTLRQLYYQFVARGLLPNKQAEYDRLGRIVSEARLAGLLDWNHLEDRTRRLADLPHWDSPQSILDAVASQYRTERWADQPERVEVWVEKEALAAVIGQAAEAQDVPWYSARGYNSQSAQWRAAQRHLRWERDGQSATVVYLGDHDPSGLDMPRDLQDRFATFGTRTRIERIALTLDQVRQFDPPPNPAKQTDSRTPDYIATYGDDVLDENGEAVSWELDALPPDVLGTLITDAIAAHRDDDRWAEATEAMEAQRRLLRAAAGRWPEVADYLDGDQS